MKMNQLFTVCGLAAALFLGAANVSAQDNGGGFGNGRGNFDPAQFQQRMMDNLRDQLGFTNDTDWSAVQPLIQKVMDARRDVGGGMGMRMMFRNRRGNDDNANGGGRRGGFFGPPSPQAEALQQAIDNHAPDAQIKQALDKYRASVKDKEAQLAQAQENLRKVLTVRQEAQATLMGLLP
ncbi:MAG: hypothetical protein WBN22_11645 [Verrucomicrobiia bacterium]